MSRRSPDEVQEYPDGTRVLIRYRRTQSSFDDVSRMRYVFDASGELQEIWHEVLDPNGNVIHRDCKSISKRE